MRFFAEFTLSEANVLRVIKQMGCVQNIPNLVTFLQKEIAEIGDNGFIFQPPTSSVAGAEAFLLT